MSAAPTTAPVRNAMTVDVEDYFQVSAFEGLVSRDDWNSMPVRVEHNTHRVLDLFERNEVHATFFVLGWVAERYPSLVQRMAHDGHEVASHGMDHTRATAQTREGFAADVRRAKALLEDVSGMPVQGYRAASFSIGRGNLWALDELQAAGYRYSSSIYPVQHDHYGMPDAPRFAFRPLASDFVEVPVSTVRFGGRNLPCGGGGYFRLLPYLYYRWSIGRLNRDELESAIFYFHPWEIDPDQPRQQGLALKSRVRHYLNLAKTESRLARLLRDFAWGRMDEIYLDVARKPSHVALAPAAGPIAHAA